MGLPQNLASLGLPHSLRAAGGGEGGTEGAGLCGWRVERRTKGAAVQRREGDGGRRGALRVQLLPRKDLLPRALVHRVVDRHNAVVQRAATARRVR